MLSPAGTKKDIKGIELTVSTKVGNFLQNEKRPVITQMERDNEKHIVIISEASYPDEQNHIVCFDERDEFRRDMATEIAGINEHRTRQKEEVRKQFERKTPASQ